MPQTSLLGRLWKAVQPPPPITRPGEKKIKLNRNQKNLLVAVGGTIVVGVSGWAVYDYVASAQERAEKSFQKGMHLMAPASYQNAIGYFTRAIGIWPTYGQAYLQRGTAHRYLNQSDAALADFEKALEIDPNLAMAYSARGGIYRARGDLRRAMQDFTKSASIAAKSDAHDRPRA